MSTHTYRAVLRAPGAGPAFAAALTGRLSYGTAPLALVLTVVRTTGSYATVGAVLALFGLTAAALAPARAALIDRHGPRRILPPLALLYGATLLALAGADGRLLLPLAGAAGACAPPLGPVMRARWSELLPPGGLLERAYSLDTVAEELLYVGGPLLVGLTGGPRGLLLSAALVVTGSLALAVRSPRGGAVAVVRAERPPSRLVSGIGRPVAVTAALGTSLGALGLLLVVAAGTAGRPGAVVWLEAALAAGSAVGGLTYGAVRWRRPVAARLAPAVAGLGAALAVAGWAPGLGLLAVLVAVAGLFVGPALTSAYLLADERADPARRTQAGTWVNTAFNAGSALGTAAAGPAAQLLPLPFCFTLAAAPLLAAALAPPARRVRELLA